MNKFIVIILGTLLPVLLGTSAEADDVPVANAPNPDAIAKIAAGTRTEANAAWWGFDSDDATDTLQSAIDSGAKKVVVPYMGTPWIVRPLTLRSDLELVFEPGVLVLAKKGEFKGKGDSLFRGSDLTDVTIRGYGAVLRMRKKDYQSADYEPAEWRMGIALRGCKRVLVEGVRVESSGGDGFYIGATKDNPWCEDVTLRDCVCYDNHRQGVSVISAQNLLVENCEFSRTEGTAPEAGIDLEPNSDNERLVNCVIRNCVMQDNAGSGIQLYLKPLSSASKPVSIRFENCLVRMGTPGMTMEDFTDINMKGAAGITIGALRDDGPQGQIEFVNCTTENTAEECALLYEKSAKGALVRFENCNFKQPWLSGNRGYSGVRMPILLKGERPKVAVDLGGVVFDNCHVYDTVHRPAIAYVPGPEDVGLRDVSGTIVAHSPVAAKAQFETKTSDITLKVVAAE